MTDLHSHILPGIDDGAADLEAALRLIESEYGQGVRNIALTSHYNCENTPVEVFLEQRDTAYRSLQKGMNGFEKKLQFKLGCEVLFSPRLLNRELDPLCLEGTNVLLLELPTNYKPPFLKEVLNYFQDNGIIPLIAHVERYSYVLREPTVLADWVQMGAYTQINAGTFLHMDVKRKLALNFLKWGLAHVIASDTHSPNKRPPNMKLAIEEIRKRLGEDTAVQLQTNADELFLNQDLHNVKIHYPRQILGRWF